MQRYWTCTLRGKAHCIYCLKNLRVSNSDLNFSARRDYGDYMLSPRWCAQHAARLCIMSPLDLLEMQASVPEVNPPFLEVCFESSPKTRTYVYLDIR